MVSSQLVLLTVLQFVLLSSPLLSLNFWFCAGSLGTDDGASRDDATQGEFVHVHVMNNNLENMCFYTIRHLYIHLSTRLNKCCPSDCVGWSLFS